MALTSSKMAEACGCRDHSESVNAIDSVRKQKPYQKIQGTTDPAVEDLQKQIKNLTDLFVSWVPRSHKECHFIW
jgi:hypothetical protein